ncbi:MAG: hypothetical protein V2A54_03340, partial [Bacteroidota bacterium]
MWNGKANGVGGAVLNCAGQALNSGHSNKKEHSNNRLNTVTTTVNRKTNQKYNSAQLNPMGKNNIFLIMMIFFSAFAMISVSSVPRMIGLSTSAITIGMLTALLFAGVAFAHTINNKGLYCMLNRKAFFSAAKVSAVAGLIVGILFAFGMVFATGTLYATGESSAPLTIKASSSTTSVIGMKIWDTTASSTLNTITVYFYDVASSGFDPTTDLKAISGDSASGVAFYKDSNNNGVYNPGVDFRADTSRSAWSAGSSPWYVTFGFGDILPTSEPANNKYFLVIQTTSGATNGHKFNASVPADNISSSSGGTAPSVAISSNTVTIDTVTPTFTMQYYSDSGLTTSMGNNPKLKAGTYYIKISASEALAGAPTISIAAEGTANDVTNNATTPVSGNNYKYTRTILSDAAAVGSVLEDISVTGTDAAGNAATNVNPTNEGTKAAYTDTTAPAISSVSIPNSAMKVNDVVTATITVGDDGGQTYTLTSGTIGGFALGSFT